MGLSSPLEVGVDDVAQRSRQAGVERPAGDEREDTAPRGHLRDRQFGLDGGAAIAQAKASLAFAPGRLEPQDGTVARFLVTAARVVPWDASGIDPGAPGRQAGMASRSDGGVTNART